MYNIEAGKFVLVTDKMFHADKWNGQINIARELTENPVLIVDTTFNGHALSHNAYGQPKGLFAVSVNHDDAESVLVWGAPLFYKKYNTRPEALRAHKKLVRIINNPQVKLFDLEALGVD